MSHFTAAFKLARQTGDENLRARAYHGLARARHAQGNAAQAWRHWQEALAIFHRTWRA